MSNYFAVADSAEDEEGGGRGGGIARSPVPNEGADPAVDSFSVKLVPVLYIDRFRVEQIIRNLVSNAIKFTPEEGRITLRFIHTVVAAASGVSSRLLPPR